ncbi:MAG: hypothetical protein E3J90_02020 [Promethearchaeota archaeon]|nr:MAG: hypothetical protein E3J90_02020 [Candidatus Lokiarchaeota archaeon]
MNNLKNRTKSTVIILLAFTAAINLGVLLTSVKAGPYVPEEHVYNGWHWGVDVGDELYWEVEMILTNASNDEVTMMFKDIWIYNITSIENVTTDWLGVNEFSLVNATQYYFNVTEGELESYGDPMEFALFGFNNSDTIKHKYRAGMGAAPYILPLNGSNNLEVDILADILNESFYDPLSLDRFNAFDGYSPTTMGNGMFFTNSSDGYYLYLEYNVTNGVAEYVEGYMKVEMGESMLLNFTIQRVLDYDITDEIEWGVTIGDIFYFDFTEGGSDYEDIKVEVTNFTDIMLPKSHNGFMEDEIPMVFQAVYCNLSLWDGIEYDVVDENFPIGLANNFYFQYFDEGGPLDLILFYPNNTAKEDIEFVWNSDTLRIWDVPFNDIELIENTNFEFTLRNTSTNFRVSNIIDKSTGIVQSFLITEHGEVQLYYEMKNQTLIDWDLEIGDVVYYKQNSQDGGTYMRATINATDGEFVNLTTWEEISGGLFTKIPGQPELQFFKAVIAELEEFDEITGTWQSNGDYIFLEANIYWAISPYAMFGGTAPPLFLPLGFTGEDFENILALLGGMFDVMTFTEDHVFLRNSTNNKEYDAYVDTTSGRITFMGGWMNMPGGDDTTWNYLSIYPMVNETLNVGINVISIPNDAISEIDASHIDIITSNTGVEIVNAILAYNPINTSITTGTVLYYNDLLITNTTGLANLSFYIKFDDSFDLDSYNLTFWAWNMSGNNEWSVAPPEATDMFVYDYGDNSLTIIFPIGGSSGPISIIMAVSYVNVSPPELIPGFPLLLTLGFLTIGVFALIMIHFKKVKKI